jgi:adenylate cyclase
MEAPRAFPEAVELLRALGISSEEIEGALQRGDAEGVIYDRVIAASDATRTLSAADVAADGGMPVEAVAELMDAFGLPDSLSFTPAEADALRELWRLRDIWPFELTIQIARLQGRLVARMAHAAIQLWVSVVEPRLSASGRDERGRQDTAATTFEQLLPVADVMLMGVHRRWLEREGLQIAARRVELAGSPLHPNPTASETTFLFCDLKDFTAFADRQGDGAAVRIIDDFVAVVTRERGPEVRLTKLLGDGVMLAYPQPGPAVRAGARIIEGVRSPGLPGVHASVHHGLAIPRQGDYFGSAVNLAARLLGAADANELVATRRVVELCPEHKWEPVGKQAMRGVSEDVEVFRLVQ